MRGLICAGLLLSLAVVGPGPRAQARGPDPASLIRAEREALAPLAWMDGRWQGRAWSTTPAGRHEIIQTERIGPLLDGSIKVVEGKSFELDGRPAAFNAFGVISFDPSRKAYSLHSHAQGRVGDFPLQLTPDGYVWTIALGPTTLRYTATLRDKVWREVGEMVRPDGGAAQMFEMTLRRIGDSDWPAAGSPAAPSPSR